MINSHASIEPSDLWKSQLKQRLQQNLDLVLSEAQSSYEHRLSIIPLDSVDLRRRVTAEYQWDVEQLRSLALEQYQTEVQRERQERMWSAQLEMEDSWSAILRKEQEAIFSAIKKEKSLAAAGVKSRRSADENQWFHWQTAVKETDGNHDANARTARAYEDIDAHTGIRHESAPLPKSADELRAEQFAKQQEEFRRREEEVRRRVSERKMQDKVNWAESVSSSDSSSPPSTRQSTPIPMSEEETLTLLLSHEDQWTRLSRIRTSTPLKWSDFPWPVLAPLPPTHPRELTLARISAYIRAPFDLDVTLTNDKAAGKERIKEQLRRWHPDRFDVKLLVRVADGNERDSVREGAGAVVRCLNELLGSANEVA